MNTLNSRPQALRVFAPSLFIFAPVRPLAEAVKAIDRRTPIGSVLRSAEWARVPLALRERAQFSAGVESVKFLQSVQDRISGQIKQQREQLANGKTATFDRSSFIDHLREIARDEGLEPEDPADKGTIRDVTSIPRLGLIYDMQNGLAQGHATWKLDQSEGALLLYPAQEFTRVEDRAVPRDDWPARFAEAASAAGDEDALRVQRDTGRMIALKNSSLWSRLSRFGTPWPPFDFGSGMGLEDIDRDEAVSLGLMKEGDVIEGAEKDFNDGLEASVADLDEKSKSRLKTFFGDQVKFDGDTVRWKGQRKTKQKAAPEPAEEAPHETPKEARTAPKTFEEAAQQLADSSGAAVVATKAPDRQPWGAQIRGEKAQIERANALAKLYADMRARFPGMPAKPTHTVLVVSSVRGRAHLDGPTPHLSTKSKEWPESSWVAIKDWEERNKRLWTTERKGSQVADNFRHELAHNLSTPEILNAWEADVMRHHNLEWFRQNVSEYAAAAGQKTEALAEAFGLCTRDDYTKGSLPKSVEDFIFKRMLGEA